jgi:hypothetical protein
MAASSSTGKGMSMSSMSISIPSMSFSKPQIGSTFNVGKGAAAPISKCIGGVSIGGGCGNDTKAAAASAITIPTISMPTVSMPSMSAGKGSGPAIVIGAPAAKAGSASVVTIGGSAAPAAAGGECSGALSRAGAGPCLPPALGAGATR